MLTWLLACAPDPAPPLDEAESCVPATPEDVQERRGDWYRCLDTTLAQGEGCGPEGYPLGFGAKYADRSFDMTYDELGPDGQAFFVLVASCLQQELATRVTPQTTCAEVWDLGFATHADCYVESGFCALPTADLLVVASMYDPDLGALPEFQASLVDVAAGCGS
jgi:hypothetical protein